MKVKIISKDNYNKNNKNLSKIQVKEIEISQIKNQDEYIISSISLEQKGNDVSLMYVCINNLLKNQYKTNNYIKLEELKEIDNLLKGLDKEQAKIVNAYSEIKKYQIKDLNEIKELIKHINEYQILEKYNLRELGIYVVEKLPEYHIKIELMPFFNFEKLGEQYLFDANIQENFCSYGLLINTKDMLQNDLIEEKTPKDKRFKLVVIDMLADAKDDNSKKKIIYLPSTKKEIEDQLLISSNDSISQKIEDIQVIQIELVNCNMEDLKENFNKLMKELVYRIIDYNDISYEDCRITVNQINHLYKNIKKFDYLQMCKFIAILETSKNTITSAEDIIILSEKVNEYNILLDVKNYEDMGRYLVEETGHFDNISTLMDYINYEKLAKDYTRNGQTYNGHFTDVGYLMKKEEWEMEQDKIDKESEEEIE